ncbi:MAG: hypothetical protein ACOZQL_08475, partial [Myxococcota bacterium]
MRRLLIMLSLVAGTALGQDAGGPGDEAARLMREGLERELPTPHHRAEWPRQAEPRERPQPQGEQQRLEKAVERMKEEATA